MQKSNYHYEYAAYTNNLCWGRILICRDRNRSVVQHIAQTSGKGVFEIVKVKVPNA